MADVFDLIANGDLRGLSAALAADRGLARGRNSAGASPLMFAAYYRNAEAVAAVREVLPALDPYEAIVVGDLPPTEGWDTNDLSPDGFSPLALAAFFGNSAAFELLLPLTRDVNRPADNAQRVAALHAATAVRQSSMVEQLLRAGADPNQTQADGFTPLHVAAGHGDTMIAALLVLFGADPVATNTKGLDAAGHARAGGHTWLAELLERHGR